MSTVPLVRSGVQSGFSDRHIGPASGDQQRMLAAIGYRTLEALTDAAVPAAIRSTRGLQLPPAISEHEALAELATLAAANEPGRAMLGLGYYRTLTPPVIRRNVLENPAWYTAYTPYQPEISQGRLEVLFGFQTMISDLTALPIANASLLDEATAAAEAMALAYRVSTNGGTFLVDADTHPQTIAVLRTRAEPLGLDLLVADVTADVVAGFAGRLAGALLSYPGSSGAVQDLRPTLAAVTSAGGLAVVAADLLALCLLTPPGECGADVVVGSAQRFGVPLGYGGPHAGFMSVRADLARQLPGRLVGASVDAAGTTAYRLALQTREQHIRRERATSNICTAQVLLAVMSTLYAEYHGPDGLRAIAERTHRCAGTLADALAAGGLHLKASSFFDTLRVEVPGRAADVIDAARARGVHLLQVDTDTVGVSCDEATTLQDLRDVAAAFGVSAPSVLTDQLQIDKSVWRQSDFLTHPRFSTHRSETAMLRYLRKLSDRDLALDRTMIPLGSCTMKLNASAEMEPITWPGFADMHPFAPRDAATGYTALIEQLQAWLAEITGYDAVSVQPNAGSQGELAGLLAISAFHAAQGNTGRDVCLIPASAHGTNAASAAMAGMRVVVVACDAGGNVALDDLHAKIEAHRESLAAIMLTYPSTHGVFEESIRDVCAAVHDAGGQVYVDGANLNALVGLARPGHFGADVSHLNLHKTFCIPHGGGGPGVGPVAVRAHLAPYLPGHPLATEAAVGPVSAAPHGSAGILPIPWAYIRMMGADGLRRATQVAILSANYVAHRLAPHYPVLYAGANGLVAHECILDLRPLTKATGVTVDDVAKRLMDYGFHAPTISFPVPGTLMVEPTESEDLTELDRFCDAMAAIRAEIDEVANGTWPLDASPLRNAPHTAVMLAEEWSFPYTRELAAFPTAALRSDKYWPPVRRIDAAYGDRNLVCACPPVSAYED